MKAIVALTAAACLLIGAIVPAHAHRLRVFATVENGAVSGYAYFVGGARAKGAQVLFRDSAGGVLHKDVTDSAGAFRWSPPRPQTLRITVDAGEGHAASITLEADRFSALQDVNPGEAAARVSGHEYDSDAAEAELSPAALAHIERHVEAAVARQVRPLLEAYEAAEARLRFNDIVGGVGMIFGLAGVAMWTSARRKAASSAKDQGAP